MVRISLLCQANSIESALPRILYYDCLLLLSIPSIQWHEKHRIIPPRTFFFHWLAEKWSRRLLRLLCHFDQTTQIEYILYILYYLLLKCKTRYTMFTRIRAISIKDFLYCGLLFYYCYKTWIHEYNRAWQIPIWIG